MSPAPTEDVVRRVVATYIRAGECQDPDLIVSVFTPTATYHERVLEEPIRDASGIRRYWQAKVVEQQDNIEVVLMNLYLDGATAIAEWEARVDDLVDGERKLMREVAPLEFDGDRICALREYRASRRLVGLG